MVEILQNTFVSVVGSLNCWEAQVYFEKGLRKLFPTKMIFTTQGKSLPEVVLPAGEVMSPCDLEKIAALYEASNEYGDIKMEEWEAKTLAGDKMREDFIAWVKSEHPIIIPKDFHVIYSFDTPHDEKFCEGWVVVLNPHGDTFRILKDPTWGNIALAHNSFIVEDDGMWDHVYFEGASLTNKFESHAIAGGTVVSCQVVELHTGS
jgi:hypothetical protein